ncbi:MAG TPA: hypothetical protein VH328_00045, partial [Burkholderiaceae bacterium]|nr:hypothetical protein [Burkholderiaceae bacterium]
KAEQHQKLGEAKAALLPIAQWQVEKDYPRALDALAMDPFEVPSRKKIEKQFDVMVDSVYTSMPGGDDRKARLKELGEAKSTLLQWAKA